jgi:dephospho-CoA kinase
MDSPRDWTTYRVGLTGGIASGKSLVAAMFQDLGVPVIDTDQIAREVVAAGSPVLARIATAFGPGVVRADGSLDRARLRTLVFADPAQRRRLEAITHPPILAAMETRCRDAGGPYQLLVIPLLVEAGLRGRVDRVLVVDCPEDVQRRRLMDRDGESAASADRLLAAQLGRAARLAAADDVLDNAGTPDDARRQVRTLHDRYLKLAS